MTITYHGDNYFKIQTSKTSILIDPTNQRSFKGADLILNTISPAATKPLQTDETFWIEHQGEYETKNIYIHGWSVGQENKKEKTVYQLILDDMTIVVLGYLTKEPSAEIQTTFKSTDIILGPSTVVKWIKKLEPSLIIPALSGVSLKKFLNEFNQENCPSENKLLIKKKDLIPSKMLIQCLSN